MAESLPPLNAPLLARYVEARIQRMLDRLVPRYWSAEVTHLELYGLLGAVAELKALVTDAERSMRGPGDEVKSVTGPDYGRRSHG
jgi:hypothetical protein